MEAYNGFARVYDYLMRDVNYDKWADYIENIFKKFNLRPNTILELACGTGNITNRLALRGYEITGVDISSEMLTIARKKAMDLGINVAYINQDMRELDMHEKVDCVLCLCDGFNYILEERDLISIYEKVYSILNFGGIFIFDISSFYKISEILGNNTYAENFEDISYIWENYFDAEREVCEFDLTIFMRKGQLFERVQEFHEQRAYRIDVVIDLLKQVKFKDINVYNAFTFESPKFTDERINFVCIK
ncbi:class I SAM-dependent DNA methyltransferase [Caminicella sporogenes]|uniref:class I SAM-dependent DNA methyltransferase n=1 Tax=Caminicella sporogenes TaxID=166485 RepID=UPI00253F7401|nr:class I SAM-dependent methyltransferase [Caminicella sporogenes]WIF94255.1 class I SAM-dependent methyltransferase [Caminicella sporogenes]